MAAGACEQARNLTHSRTSSRLVSPPPASWNPQTWTPSASTYLSAVQRDGQPLLAGELYRETWAWLDARGVASFVSPRLIEAYAQAFARYIQCEEAISKFGLLGKHPTTGAAIASPFVAMSQSFSKQANVYWYEIYEIVRATSTREYAGSSPGDDLMERLLQSRT